MHLTEKEYTQVYDDFLDHGVTRKTAKALLRLLKHVCGDGTLEDWERERWQAQGVIDDQGRLILKKNEQLEDLTLWLIFAGIWEGIFERADCKEGP